MPSLRLARSHRPRRDPRVPWLWSVPHEAAFGFALIERAAHQLARDLWHLDQWAAREINRRLTEQWAWDVLDGMRVVLYGDRQSPSAP